MVNCPVCDAAIDVEEDELDEGEALTCDECGADLTVAGLTPLELESASSAVDGDTEDDFDLDEEDDEDEDDEDEDDDEDDEEADDDDEEDWK